MAQRSDRLKSLASVSQFRLGALRVQPERLTILRDGEEITLEPRMMEVLVALAERAGEVISAEQLLIEIWRGTFYGDNPVHKTIAQLRRRLGDDSRTPSYIETIRKRGYRVIATVAFPDDYRSGLPRSAAWMQGSPYVGLHPFDDAHAAVFFGRSRATADLLTALRSQIDHQRRFVLVVGASGCGKTSLLRAGALPLLQQDGGFDGLQALSVAYSDLGACRGGDLLGRLTDALCEWSLDGRPVFLPSQRAELARQLRHSPGLVQARIDDAFQRLAPKRIADLPRAHLLLVIDHAEAVVATPGITDDDRTDLGAALAALCAVSRLAVVMLTRSDFYPRLIEAVPAIAELKASDGHLDLLTPRVGEIGQIIRAPAALAGLSFEEDPDSSTRLDDVLRDAAAHHPETLPLLQHTLQALYDRQTDGGLLTLGAYRELGGLEGALAHHAERAFAALPAAAQQRLDRVLSHLIVVHPDSDAVTARRVLWSSLDDEPSRTLAEAFVQARLFVSELVGGEPGFGVAHEALLRQWPRAQEWVSDNRHLLHARERLQRAAQRWAAEGRRSDHLLNPGRPLHEARDAAQRLPADLGEDDRAFLRASERLYRRKQWLRATAVGGLAVLTVASIALGLQARLARSQAERHRDQAQGLVSYMLGPLADQLRPLGNLKLLDSVGTQALAYLERLPETGMHAQELINHARALRTVGEVLMNQGRFDEARAAFQRSATAAQHALKTAPDSLEALAETGTAAYWQGYYEYRQSRLPQARAYWMDYLRASEHLTRRAPAKTEWQLELSYALNNLGTLARDLQQSDEAVGLFRRSVDLKTSLLAQRSNDKSLQYELVDSLSWLSSSQENQGQLTEASEGYRQQIEMLRLLIRDEPEADAWRRRLATALLSSSELALSRGLMEQSRREAEESLSLLSALVKQRPDNQTWQRDLAHAHAHIGWVFAIGGEREKGLAHLRQAQLSLKPLLDDKKPLPAWQWLAAIIRLRTMQFDPTSIDNPGLATLVIDDLQTLHKQAPADLIGRAALAQALMWRGERLAAVEKTSQARQDWNQAKDLLSESAPMSKDKALLDPWIRIQIHLGYRAEVVPQIEWLRKAGYRHPIFTPAYDPPTAKE